MTANNTLDTVARYAASNFTAATATRSSRYRVFDTEALVRSVVANIGVQATIKPIASKRRVGTKHSVELTLHKGIELLGTTCFPRVYIHNSYGGESALRITVGFYRLVCANGMTVGTVSFKRSINHTMAGERQYAQLQQGIVEAVEYCYTRLTELAESLNSKTVTVEQYETILDVIRASARYADRMQQAIRFPRPEDRTGPVGSDGLPTVSLWNLWSILNEQMRSGARSEQALLERNIRLTNALMAMAAA